MLKLQVSNLGGPVCSFNADLRTSVFHVKDVIASLTRIGSWEQQLLLDLVELDDFDNLSEVVPGPVAKLELMLVRRPALQAADHDEDQGHLLGMVHSTTEFRSMIP
eukprot:CAMPEP_0179085044 /NCGR_PEP_ID=MMETSP0796-20121207/38492_1 /TAXON_ID=73915 /ORGANISM="Pyrodinium bahamense, Strain pbaha01" /LENGTH=105 /DNA_ID=CAMNT_0020782473 /DNA_START=54 /DNA_END=372 /DNA_ORIENTATION=-